jgi:hypothetical protein
MKRFLELRAVGEMGTCEAYGYGCSPSLFTVDDRENHTSKGLK